MAEPSEEITEEERAALIDGFESNGFAIFDVAEDQALFAVFMDYIKKNLIPTYTDIDRDEGTITITKRPMGSLESG